jgi:hypothetical protein
LPEGATGVKAPTSVSGKRRPALNSLSDERLAREWRTMQAMIRCFCRGKHGTAKGICAACRELQDYAQLRLERCRFGPEKPTCAKCPVHCYQRSRREEIRDVMRYAGPRMLWEHPILSLRHWLDSFRKTACANDLEEAAGKAGKL